jgi:hypothetical protein
MRERCALCVQERVQEHVRVRAAPVHLDPVTDDVQHLQQHEGEVLRPVQVGQHRQQTHGAEPAGNSTHTPSINQACKTHQGHGEAIVKQSNGRSPSAHTRWGRAQTNRRLWGVGVGKVTCNDTQGKGSQAISAGFSTHTLPHTPPPPYSSQTPHRSVIMSRTAPRREPAGAAPRTHTPTTHTRSIEIGFPT